jgi:hypothetical protein
MRLASSSGIALLDHLCNCHFKVKQMPAIQKIDLPGSHIQPVLTILNHETIEKTTTSIAMQCNFMHYSNFVLWE